MESSTKYILKNGTLSRKDSSLHFKSDTESFHIPVEGIKEIYCLGEVTVNSKLLKFLSKKGIALHFFDYYENYSGTFYPKEKYISGKLTIEQTKAHFERKLDISKSIVKKIGENIHTLLYHYYRHGNEEVKEFLDWIKEDFTKNIIEEASVDNLMLLEADLWERFYGSFRFFLKEDFRFDKRTRQPPENPINALISFGNTILYMKTISQIYHTSLDQSISFLHSPSKGRFSLSLDLSEAFKPVIVFKTIFDCINNRRLNIEKHFQRHFNCCILNDDGRKIFLKALEERFSETFEHPVLKRRVSYLSAIKYDGHKLMRSIIEKNSFTPFSMKEHR